MEIQFTIVRSENKEYLCYKAGEAYVDASNPMIAFATGEDEFEIVEPDSSFRQKEYEFRGEQYYLVPEFYRNGWLALTLVMVEDEDEYIVLSVNLEEMDALGLPYIYRRQSLPRSNGVLGEKRTGNRFRV